MHILLRAFGHICTFGPPDPSPRSKQRDDPSSSLLSFRVMKRNATFVTEDQQNKSPTSFLALKPTSYLDTEGAVTHN
jgi:hypothetical protein